MDNNNVGAWAWNRKQETGGTLHSDPIDGGRTGTRGDVPGVGRMVESKAQLPTLPIVL